MVEVTEGIVASVPQDVSIDDAGTIEGARPIEVTDRSRRVRIEFSNVLTYQVTDESYAEPASGKMKEAENFLPKFYSELMKVAKTGTIKKRTASRKISRITKKIKSLKNKAN